MLGWLYKIAYISCLCSRAASELWRESLAIRVLRGLRPQPVWERLEVNTGRLRISNSSAIAWGEAAADVGLRAPKTWQPAQQLHRRVKFDLKQASCVQMLRTQSCSLRWRSLMPTKTSKVLLFNLVGLVGPAGRVSSSPQDFTNFDY